MKFCASKQYFDSLMTKAMTKTSPNAPPPSSSLSQTWKAAR
ncbi:hypothetical protein CFP56_040818 [Quercus suber]|uniref:Uncharacterized protein n=1 Tax=Quercus suber TaxID=58331 RepID=A0AAW0LJN7_QUESU